MDGPSPLTPQQAASLRQPSKVLSAMGKVPLVDGPSPLTPQRTGMPLQMPRHSAAGPAPPSHSHLKLQASKHLCQAPSPWQPGMPHLYRSAKELLMACHRQVLP